MPSAAPISAEPRPMKLLVLDDQEAVAAVISRVAQQGGWEARNVSTPKDLEGIIRREKVDVLMIDYFIEEDGPRRTGLDIVENLRASGLKLPIILFTGRPELVDEASAKAQGILCVLAKPVSIHDLRTSLNEAKKQILNESPGDAAGT